MFNIMERSRLLRTLLFFCLFGVSFGRVLNLEHGDKFSVYNHTLAKILVEYNAAVYESDLTELFTWTCSRCNGMTKGFEIIELIVDVQHCLQAYVGVAKDLNAIIVAFRGTQEHSIQNWVEDLYWKQLDLNYPDKPDAMVHHGFYNAYHNTTLRPGVVDAVKRTKQMFGEMDLIVIGHSMGGAMAAICALDLTVHHGIKSVQVTTFGQPRIGNSAFASYYSQFVPNTIRVTHEHDMVPHLPPYYPYFRQKSYHHFPREVWLYNIGFGSLIYTVEKICDLSGEDPSCSRSVMGNSVLDHLVYYGVNLAAETWNSCRIVSGPHLLKYATTDHAGNIILSKHTGSTVYLRDGLSGNGATVL
ncbi:lipase-like isoform X1 [Chenopodium quinoa]|uniref:lipase-like isoform X1 n=2 Tax=Chenopodium quinoa TaxID=63459 RepID=UPI000B786005|nr:lipase-like isoform X1 [Chenopodium quinoa]